jgi:cell division septal protein FtsQ
MKLVSTGNMIHSPGFHKKLKLKRRLKLVAIFILFSVFLGFFIYGARHEKLLINEITVLGDNVIGREELKKAISDEISGNYFWFLPKKNIFIYPRFSLEKKLIEIFPRFESVNVKIDDLNSLLVEVEERQPTALYCFDEKCYFLDSQGLIFAEAPVFSRGVYIAYTDSVNIPHSLGSQFLTTEEFQTIDNLVRNNFIVLDINPALIKIGDRDVELVSDKGVRVIWPRFTDPQVVFSNLSDFLLSEAIKSQQNFLERVDYLDLRTDNKVFYRFKN